ISRCSEAGEIGVRLCVALTDLVAIAHIADVAVDVGEVRAEAALRLVGDATLAGKALIETLAETTIYAGEALSHAGVDVRRVAAEILVGAKRALSKPPVDIGELIAEAALQIADAL